jgi:hypothetical protein
MGFLIWGITSAAAGAAAAAAGNITLGVAAVAVALAALVGALVWRIGQPDPERHRPKD